MTDKQRQRLINCNCEMRDRLRDIATDIAELGAQLAEPYSELQQIQRALGLPYMPGSFPRLHQVQKGNGDNASRLREMADEIDAMLNELAD